MSDLASVRSDRRPLLRAVAELAVAAVFRFPLGLGAARIGILTVVRSRPSPLSPLEQMDDALALAPALTRLFLDGSNDPAAPLPAEAPGAWQRAVAHQAAGRPAFSSSVPLTTALLRLRVAAFGHNESLTEPARAAVSRRLRFGDPSDGATTPDESKE
ncbi:hypothetical protein ACFY2W_36365 [Streptomyces sp. NPDC001262]|uniref:hypothetical protein n=1 Tax=unclassified Streptomyces TaxID=2593676 RepID=UPI00367A51F8